MFRFLLSDFGPFWKVLRNKVLVPHQDFLLDLACHEVESLSDVDVILGADLEKIYTKTFSHLLALLKGHLAFRGAVGLVGYKHFDNILCGVGFDLTHPVLQRIEGISVGDGVDHDDAHCPFIVGLGDGLKSLLSGRVPDLQAYLLPINVNGFDFEVDADGGEVGTHEIVLAETKEDVGLADCAVADYQQFCQVVVVLVSPHCSKSKIIEYIRQTMLSIILNNGI